MRDDETPEGDDRTITSGPPSGSGGEVIRLYVFSRLDALDWTLVVEFDAAATLAAETIPERSR